MSGLTDEELPGYCLVHCETERGQFHKDHIVRLLRLAGRDDDAAKIERGREWLFLGPGFIRPIVKGIPGYEGIAT